MRILMVSNLYPPYYLGGYEIRCAQVAEALQRAGHEVQVITSEYQVARGGEAVRTRRREVRGGVVVHRCLREYIFPPRFDPRPWSLFQARRELQDARHFRRVVTAFQPDIVNWWSMLGASKLLLPQPRRWGIPEIYWIEQAWFPDQHGPRGELTAKFWNGFREGQWAPGLLRPAARWLVRRLESVAARHQIETRDFGSPMQRAVFVSEFMRRRHQSAGVPMPASEVIFGGAEVDRFLAPVRPIESGRALRLLYAGQVNADRGLHTILEALGLLTPAARGAVSLDVVGEGPAGYGQRVRALAEELELQRPVAFRGRVPHQEMPAVYRDHDLLVFASLRDEGLPLTIIEALLAGCAVVSTEAGGAQEVVALAGLPAFAPGNAGQLAEHIERMILDRALVRRIAERGQEVARADFSFETMMTRFSAALEATVR